jgi:hypothetical protein
MTRSLLTPEPSLAEACYASLAKLNIIIDSLTDDWQRTMLTNWRDHYWGEAIGDLDAIMATLAPDPVYQFFGWGAGERTSTTEAARTLYSRLIDIGYRPAGPIDDMRFAFADWGLTSQLTLTGVYPGFVFGGDFDPEATYRMMVNVMQSHPYDRQTGLMCGEIVFQGEPTEIVRVQR